MKGLVIGTLVCCVSVSSCGGGGTNTATPTDAPDTHPVIYAQTNTLSYHGGTVTFMGKNDISIWATGTATLYDADEQVVISSPLTVVGTALAGSLTLPANTSRFGTHVAYTLQVEMRSSSGVTTILPKETLTVQAASRPPAPPQIGQ